MSRHITEWSRDPGPFLLIGRDAEGKWIVEDEHGLCGGLFLTKKDAVRFAMDESERRPQSVLIPSDDRKG